MNRASWQKILLVILFFAAISWISYNYLLKSKFEELSKLKKSFEDLNAEVSSLGEKNVQLDTESINKEIAKRLSEISEKAPSEVDLPYIIEKFIFESLKGLDIEYTFVQPQQAVKEDSFKRVPINIDISAKFEPLTQYIQRLENMPFTIRIDNMDISKSPEVLDKNGQKIEDSQTLIVKLTISLFAMPGGTSTLGSVESTPNISQIPLNNPFFENEFSSKEVNISAQKYKTPVKTKRTRPRKIYPILKGIYKGETTKAFINDSIYGVGDIINGYIITQIADNFVVLTKDGKAYTLKLGGK